MALLSAGETLVAIGDGLGDTLWTVKRFMSLSLCFWAYQVCEQESTVVVSVPLLPVSVLQPGNLISVWCHPW